MSFRFETPRGSVPRPDPVRSPEPVRAPDPVPTPDSIPPPDSVPPPDPVPGSRLGSRDIDWRCVTLVMAAAESGAAFP